jgi:hypothetical protein
MLTIILRVKFAQFFFIFEKLMKLRRVSEKKRLITVSLFKNVDIRHV